LFKVPLPHWATVYTHLGQGITVLRDPPQPPLKKGDFESGSPFFKGGWGDQTQLRLDQKTCVCTVAHWDRAWVGLKAKWAIALQPIASTVVWQRAPARSP